MTDIDFLLRFYKIKKSHVEYFRDYIHSKLDNAGLTDYDGFISYWRDCTSWFLAERPQGVKSPWRFDCTALITRIINQSFRLELGDILTCGIGGSNLIYRDDDFQTKIYHALTGRGMPDVEIIAGNVDFWNNALRDGKVLIPIKLINEIMKQRERDVV